MGFTLFMLNAVFSGKMDEVINLAGANLWRSGGFDNARQACEPCRAGTNLGYGSSDSQGLAPIGGMA